MNSELLAQALSRIRTLTILKSTVGFSDTLEAIVALHPDIAIVSLHFAEGSYKGVEVLRRIRKRSVNTRAIVLVDDLEDVGVIDAFRAGARGIFRRSTSLNLLGRCISAVHGGQVWASSADLQRVMEALQTAAPFRVVSPRAEGLLTSRERELLPLVANGLTNREITTRLGVSKHTVKNRLFRMYEKLGISSRVELILYALSESEKKVES